jgi:hypothetical protein
LLKSKEILVKVFGAAPMVIPTHSLFHCHWSWHRNKATAVLEAFALVTPSLWEVAVVKDSKLASLRR